MAPCEAPEEVLVADIFGRGQKASWKRVAGVVYKQSASWKACMTFHILPFHDGDDIALINSLSSSMLGVGAEIFADLF